MCLRASPATCLPSCTSWVSCARAGGGALSLGPARALVPPALPSLAEVKIDFVPRQGESRALLCHLHTHPPSTRRQGEQRGSGRGALRPSPGSATQDRGPVVTSLSLSCLISKVGSLVVPPPQGGGKDEREWCVSCQWQHRCEVLLLNLSAFSSVSPAVDNPFTGHVRILTSGE